jgi:hypothetical protein
MRSIGYSNEKFNSRSDPVVDVSITDNWYKK